LSIIKSSSQNSKLNGLYLVATIQDWMIKAIDWKTDKKNRQNPYFEHKNWNWNDEW